MERADLDPLAHRLVANPHDEDALARAHHIGEADPKAYAGFLEQVGNDTPDPAYAAYWLAQAGNVWITTLGDAHRAARALMASIDKDPTAPDAAERLAELYREKGDAKALAALLDRRAKALGPLAVEDGQVRDQLAGIYEELGQVWSEPPLDQPKKAVESFKKALELDPSSAFATFHLRELYKRLEDWSAALPLYGAELALEQDPERRLGLFRDEAATRKLAGDLRGATRALSDARAIDDSDPTLQQEYASSILDRLHAGETVEGQERTEAHDLLLELAEAFEGEHGLAYAGAALDLMAGDDRALELYLRHAEAVGGDRERTSRCSAYLAANPNGALAERARQFAGPEAEEDLSNLADLLEAEDQPTSASDKPPASFKADRTTTDPPRTPAAPVETPRAGVEAFETPSRRPPALSQNELERALETAHGLASAGNKAEAYEKYKEVLGSDPGHSEALAWTEDYLRGRRDYAELRDVLLASVRGTARMPELLESRKDRLREVAGLCEGNLRDVDGAIAAWRQLLALDRRDESAGVALTRLLERSQRWDDLANLLEQEATIEQDLETKLQLEKRLAKLHEDKRKDLVAAGEAYARIGRLVVDDDQPVVSAARLFERAERIDLAADVVDEGAQRLDEPVARGHLLERLGAFRERLGEAVAAGDAYAGAAEALRNAKLWDDAERLYVTGEAFSQAANAAHQRGLSTTEPKGKASHFARAAGHLTKAGRADEALERLAEATNLDPLSDDYAEELAARYDSVGRLQDLVAFLKRRGDRLSDKAKRVDVRRHAASLATTRLADADLSRELWLKVLEDGDDAEALGRLVDDAVAREDYTEATTLLRRLRQNATDKAEKTRVALREAELLADGVGDVDTALARYEFVLADLDPACRPALQAIADLQEARDGHAEATRALERELELVSDVQERGQIAARLARLYDKLDDSTNAIRAIDLVRKADPEDFDALTRLCELCEITAQWGRVAELLVERIEVEADDTDAIELTRKLATVLAEKLDRGAEALAALTDLADGGNAAIRHAYVELGDRLGHKALVASKLKEWWFDARSTAERTAALRGAFERFAEVRDDDEAKAVGIDLVRTKAGDRAIAEELEAIAVRTQDDEALTTAHDLLAREVSGEERATELVRQAEVRVDAGLSRGEALTHGEQGLSLVGASEVGPLLDRLAALAEEPSDVIGLYERQVTRSKAPNDRVAALARAAQVAAVHGQPERARGFFELALASAPSEETLAILESSARSADEHSGGQDLRRALCEGLAAGGHGARDGGRTRASLLRRAATIAHRELSDLDSAFGWLGDALVAHVETETLDLVEELAEASSEPGRADASFTRALDEVFDGPLVRQLLARRAKLRRERLDDAAGAATDLKKIHDLAPNDQAVIDELAGLLIELGDYKMLVQLYEDQILRGKDLSARADLARRIARIWEEQLIDAREAADAWRRVLRLKSGDAEATEGLERAKRGTEALKQATGEPALSYAPPKLVTDNPVMRPERAPGKVAAQAKVTGTREPMATPVDASDGTSQEDASFEPAPTSETAERGDAPASEPERGEAPASERGIEPLATARKTRESTPTAEGPIVDEDAGARDYASPAAGEALERAREATLSAETAEAKALDEEPDFAVEDVVDDTHASDQASDDEELDAEDGVTDAADDVLASTDDSPAIVEASVLADSTEATQLPSRPPPRSIPPPLPPSPGGKGASGAPPALGGDVATTLAALDGGARTGPAFPRTIPRPSPSGKSLVPPAGAFPGPRIGGDARRTSASELEELVSGDLLDDGDSTGAERAIEPLALSADDDPDDVVVADDLAEIVDEDDDDA